MTLVKKKYRYVCIYLVKDRDDKDGPIFSDFTRDFYKRFMGLYGSINFHKSRIRIVNVVAISPQFVTIKCKLEFTDSVLLSLYFANYPLLILPVSGTIKKLKKRVQDFLIYIDFLLDS